MKFKRISTRMLAVIVPILILSMTIMTMISVVNSSNSINEQISYRMDAELEAADYKITSYLEEVTAMAETLSRTVGNTYQTADMDTYEALLSEAIQDNDMVLGSGIWFEPYVYDEENEYVGPYVYKDGDSVVMTWDYSNAEYDYFSQEYYTYAMASDGAVITDPYFDSTTSTVMASCSMPIFDNGTYIGCVTVDIELSSIQEVIDSIQVGEHGSAILLDSVGTYLAGVTDDLLSSATNITADSVASLATAGSEILANTSGTTTYTDPDYGGMNLYYNTIDLTGWHIMIRMPQEEISEPSQRLATILIIVAVIAILIEAAVVVFMISAMSKGIGRVNVFAGNLADGDFTIDPIQVKTVDEVGTMSRSLNDMYKSNKDVIQGISEYAVELDESSKKLNEASKELSSRFEEIQKFMSNVNEDMLNTSAATQQVNASSEEVLSNVNLLTGQTEENMQMSKDIKVRAADVEKSSKEAYESATNLTVQFEDRLNRSIENAKVVETISVMADSISGIAEEINLLSLNASIEAARAGEAGRGFAVVATEIGNLAGSTSTTVSQIQSTIAEVQTAFEDLTEAAKGMLDFVENTVTPDYNKFVDVAGQYGQDADAFEESSSQISDMATNIRSIMGEVSSAIQNIAEATQETTDISGQIMDSIVVANDHVGNVASMSAKQEAIADDLTETVGHFKLDDKKVEIEDAPIAPPKPAKVQETQVTKTAEPEVVDDMAPDWAVEETEKNADWW